MARPIGLSYNTVSLARKVTAADVANTDVALPPTTDATNGGKVSGNGLQTVWLALECPDGTNPTATVAPRVRDPEAPDGSRWKDLTIGGSAQSVTLASNGAFKEVRVDARDWIPVVTAITGGATSYKILVMPGTPQPWHRPPSF